MFSCANAADSAASSPSSPTRPRQHPLAHGHVREDAVVIAADRVQLAAGIASPGGAAEIAHQVTPTAAGDVGAFTVRRRAGTLIGDIELDAVRGVGGDSV